MNNSSFLQEKLSVEDIFLKALSEDRANYHLEIIKERFKGLDNLELIDFKEAGHGGFSDRGTFLYKPSHDELLYRYCMVFCRKINDCGRIHKQYFYYTFTN